MMPGKPEESGQCATSNPEGTRMNPRAFKADVRHRGTHVSDLLETLKTELRAVKISGNWRVTFLFVEKDADDVDYEDYH